MGWRVRIITLLILLGLTTNSGAEVALGVQSGPNSALLIHDFSMFDIDSQDVFGLNRYGFGRGQLEVSDKPGIKADNRSGIFLLGEHRLNAGIEVAGGQVAYQDRPLYQWQPAVSMGYKDSTGPLSLYVGPRAGYSYENHINTPFVGGVLTIEFFNYGATYWTNEYTGDKSKLKVYDFNFANRLNIQKRLEDDQEFYYMGYRFDLR